MDTRRKGQIMFSDEFLTVIKEDREREIKAAQRAHLLDPDPFDEEAAGTPSRDKDRSIGRIVRPSGQSGRATADPSL
jgi:hypothetical protein